MKDVFGKALLDYFNENYTEDLITSTHISEEDELPLPYLFRTYEDMPELEKTALKLAKGKILDVGCGSGLHSLFLQKNGKDVKAIDYSKGAIEVAKKRGVLNCEYLPLLEETQSFDTILLLMNGTGIFQTIKNVTKYLKHLKSILNDGGQILIDSSDIKYMYQDDDGGFWMDTNANYYGELDFFLSYKGEDELPMKWLYLDFNTLLNACNEVNLKCELLLEGNHHDYLARISS